MVLINERSLTLGEELGQGEFGSVLRGKYKPPGHTGKPVSARARASRTYLSGRARARVVGLGLG